MGVFKQFGLLLKQNFLERKRRWGITLLEVGWPIVLLIVIVTVRNMYPIEDVEECKYEPRAMPSSGLLPLMQSYACNLNATPSCMNNKEPAAIEQSRARTSALKSMELTLKDSGPLFTQLSLSLEKSAPALEQLSIALEERPEIEEFLNVTGNLMTKDLFKNADALKTSLIKSYGIDEELVDAIFESTINITQAAQLLQDFDSGFCGSNSSYLTKYLVLPKHSNVSLQSVNEALCKLDADSKTAILDLLQDEFDTSAVVSIAKRIMGVFTPNASEVVSDIQKMMEIVSKLSSFQGLAKEFPNIKNALDFAMEMLSFAQKVSSSMPVSPELIGELMEKFDPLITQWSRDSQVWKDIKRGIWYLNQALSWASSTLEKLPDMKISLGNLYTDGGKTVLDLFNTTVTDSHYLVSVLSQSRVHLQKMMEWQNMILSSNNGTGCSAVETFFSTFEYPENVDESRLDAAINSTVRLYCQLDPNALINELSSKTNFAALLEEFANYANSTVGEQTLDWSTVIKTGWELVDLITRLQGYFEKYATLIERLIDVDLSQMFSAFTQPFAFMQNGSWSYEQVQNAMYQSITNGLDLLESILKNTPIWPYIRNQLVMQNIFGELSVDAFNLTVEAIKVTDKYFSQNQTEQFVALFINLDAVTQEAVVRGLTTPENVKAMIRAPTSFGQQLCTNMSGLLGLTLDSSTENAVKDLFCSGKSFTMPPGLSDEMVNIGNHMQDKIDKIVAVFTKPGALESSEYDSFASLSGQLRVQMDINSMLTDAVMNTKLYRTASLRLATSSLDWAKYMNVVPYSIMASNMEVLGEALETSEGWTAVAPYVLTFERTVQHSLSVMDKQQALVIGNSTRISRILDWILRYGPEKFSLTIQAVQDPEKMNKVTELLFSGNPLDIVQLDCNQALQDWFYGKDALNNLPMARLQQDICQPNFANAIYAEILDVYNSDAYVAYIRDVFSTSEKLTVDWVKLSKMLTDLPQIGVESSKGYAVHFQQYNWQTWADFLNETLTSLMSQNSVSQLSTMMPDMIRQLESMFGNTTEWLIAKHAFNIIDVMSVQLADRYADILANGLTLDTIFENSTKIREFIISQNNLSPDIVDALFNTLIDPLKLTSELFTRNFTGQMYCKDIFISQFIEFRDQAEADRMDEVFCGMTDYEGLLAELQTDRVSQAVTMAMEPLLIGLTFNNLTDITVDYAAFSNHTGEMIQALIALQNFKGPFFPSLADTFNTTVNNLRYQAALDRLLAQDMSHWPQVLDKITQQLNNKSTLNEIGRTANTIWGQVTMQVQMNMFYSKVALQQLRALAAAAKAKNGYFNLADFVLPGELKKILIAFDKAPEMTDTLLYSLIQLMNDPAKLANVQLKPEILDDMCTDLSVFGVFFTLPPESAVTLRDMQESMCSLSVNVTVLVQELTRDIEGVEEYIKYMTIPIVPSDDLFTQMFNVSMHYTKELQDIIEYRYNNNSRTIQFELPRWMDRSVWEAFALRAQNYTSSAFQGVSQADGYIAMIYGLSPVIDQYANSDAVQIRAFRTAGAILDYLVASFAAYRETGYNDTTFLSGLDELSTIDKLYRQIPDFVESFVVTSVNDQSRIQEFITLLTTTAPGQSSIEIFCAMDQSHYQKYFIIPDGNNGDFSQLQRLLCDPSSVDRLMDDLRALTKDSSDFDSILKSLNESVTPPPFSTAAFLDSSREFYNEISSMINFFEFNGDRANEVLQVDAWRRVMWSIDGVFRVFIEPGFSSKQLRPMLNSLNLNMLAPELVPYVHTAMAISNVTLRKLQPLNQSTVDILDFTRGYPETTKAMELFNYSADIVELLMYAGSSVKLTALAQLPADQVLPTLCAADWRDYFHLGANPVVDVDGVKTFFCSVDWNAVYSELITDLEIPYIESQLNNTSPLVWTEVYATIDALIELVKDVSAIKPTFKYYPWMNETEWVTMLERAGKQVSQNSMSFEFQIQSILANLMQVAPTLDQLADKSGIVTKLSIRLNDRNIQFLTAVIKKLQESNWDISAVFASSPEITKLLNVAEELPGFVDILLQTSLQPEKMAPLIKRLLLAGNNTAAEFCTISDLQQYVVYDNKTNLGVLTDLICNGMVNFTAVVEELKNLTPNISKLETSLESVQNRTVVRDLIVTVSEFVTTISSVNFTNALGVAPQWLQPSTWTPVFNRFAKSVSQAGPFDIMRVLNLFQMIGVDQVVGPVIVPELHVANAVLDVAIRKLELLNRTEINLTSIIENSPETVKALDILPHLADIVEVLMASSQTPEFSALFSEPNPESAITAICTNSAETYFKVPTGSSVDLDQIVTLLCSKNWTAVGEELMADVNVKGIMVQMNNTSPVNLTLTMARVNRMNDLIQYIIANPPKFEPQWTWLNDTVWVDMFMRFSKDQQLGFVDMISGYFFGVLKPMFGNSAEFNQAGVVMEGLLDSLRRELTLWNRPGENVTVAQILGTNTTLNDFIVRALQLTPDMYALFMSVSIRNAGDLQILYSSPDPQALLCGQDGTWSDYVHIPSQVNITQVEKFICSANFTVLAAQVMERFNINDIITALENNATANWEKIQADLSEVFSTITALTQQAPNVVPPFDLNRFFQIAEDVMNEINWSDIGIYMQMSESMMRYLRTQPFWSDVKPYFEINQLVSTWVFDLVNRLNVQPDLSLNLADLFPNATLLNEYISASLSIDEKTSMQMLAEIIVKPHKISSLFTPTADNSSAIIKLACDSTMFADFFSVPADADVNALSSALCNMVTDGGATFVEQMKKSLNIDTLIQKINDVLQNRSSVAVSARAMYKQQMELSAKITSFFNATSIMYKNIDLKEKFMKLSNETTMQSYLLAITKKLPQFEIELVGDALNGMMPLLKSMDWWVEAEKYFKMMNVLAEVGANRTAELPTVNLTLRTLIRNADSFRKLLSDSFAFTPDLFEGLMNAEFTLSPADLIKVNSTHDLQDLFCTARFPPTVNVTAVRIILCDTNFQLILDEFLSEFDLDIVIQEIGKIDVYSNVSSDFDWNDLLRNTNNLAENLGLFFTSLQPPPVPEFFLYDGNMTLWFERLNKAFMSTNNVEAYYRQMAMALKNLESSMAGTPEYKNMIVISQIIQNYLDLAISKIDTFSQEVSLELILRNKTDLIALVEASFGAAPEILELFLTQPMASNQLTALLSDPAADPCTMDLSVLFVNATPADIVKLQNLFCTINITALFNEIKKEIETTYLMPAYDYNANATTFDWQGYMNRFTQLSKRIEDLIRSPPSINPDLLALVNVTEYMQMFDRVQKYWMTQQFQFNANSFSALMQSLNPLLSSSQFGHQLSKFIKVADIIINRVKGKLNDIKNNDISLNTLLGDATELKKYLETAVNMPPETVASLLMSQLGGEALLMLVTGRSSELCSLDADKIIILPEGGSADLDQVKSLFCDANFTVFLNELSNEFDISSIIQTLSANSSAPVQWDRLFNNTQQLASVITYLATNDPLIDQKLLEAFNMSRFAPVWQSLSDYDPTSLLRLLDIYNPLIRQAAGESWPVIQGLINQYSTSITNTQRVLADLVSSGFTFESLLNNRTALMEFFAKIADNSFDLVESSYVDMYRDSMTKLLQRDEIQAIMCNSTALGTLLPNLPSYVDLSAVFCGVKDDSWVDSLLSRNYSILEAQSVLSAIDNWYFDEYLKGVYTYDYITSYRSDMYSRYANVSLGDLEEPVKQLLGVLSNLGTIPPQLFPGFNYSYWMPMIEALSTSYAQKAPEQVLRTLELMEPLLRDSAFWNTLRTSVTAASQYMSWINDKLEEIDQKGQTIQIVKLLPDLDKVKSLLESAMSPKSAAEFLTLAFHPAKLVQVLTSDPSTVLCDADNFNKSFQFTPGVDIETVQKDLCHASQNGSLVMQQVWEMYDLKKLASELSALTGGKQPTNQLTESPFRSMLKQIQRFLQNANVITRLLQAFNRDMPDIASYLSMALNTVNTVVDPTANNVGGMCDALVNLIDEVPEFVQFQPNLVRAQIVNSIMAQVATSLDELDDFLCEIPSLNMSMLLRKIADSELIGVADEIAKLGDASYLSSAQFKCSEMIRDSMLPQQKIQQMIADAMNGSFDVCINKLLTENITLISDLSTYSGIVQGLQDLLKSEVLESLKWLEPIRPLIDDVIASLLSDVQVTRLEALVNQTAIQDLLDMVFQTNSSLISADSFLNSYFKVDQLLALLKNTTAPEAETLICDSEHLKNMVQGDIVYVDKMKQTLCVNRDALTQLLQAMSNNLDSDRLSLLEATKEIEEFISRLSNSLSAIMNEIFQIANLPRLLSLFEDFDMSTIQEIIPLIQKAFNSEIHLDIIVDNLIKIIDLLETRVIGMTNNSDLADIFSDMRTLVNGISGLDTLRRSMLVHIPLKQIFSQTSDLEQMLIKDVGLAPDVVKDLLDANFTTSLMVATSVLDIQSQLCDPKQIQYLIALPKTSKLTYEQVSKMLCGLHPDVALNISVNLVKNLDVSDMIANFINQRLGIDTAELREAVQELSPIQDELTLTVGKISDATKTLRLPPSGKPAASTAAQTGAQASPSFMDMMCGRSISGYEAEQEALSDVDFGEIDAEAIDASGVNDPDYFQGPKHAPISHCDKIRKELFKQKGGRILWKYLKPMLVGKILYSPNTNMSRELVKNVNASFDELSKIIDTVKIIVESQKKIVSNFEDKDRLSKLQPEKMNTQASLTRFKSVDPALIRTVLKTDLNVAALSDQLDLFLAPENQALLSSLASVVDYGDCISLDRFVGVATEKDLEEMAGDLHAKGEFIAAIVFTNLEPTSQDRRKRAAGSSALPKHIQYKIRMDIDNVESTMELQEMFYSAAPRDNVISDMRYLRGFVQIQEMVDRAIIKLHGGDNSITKTPALLQQMPAACYKTDIFMGYVYPYIVPIIMTLSWLFSVAHCIKTLTAYRESGLEELMKVMGLKQGVVWISWFTNTFLGMTVLSVISTIFLMFGQVLILSNGVIVFLYLLTFSFSTIMFCYMVGSFFTKANVASAIGVMVFLISYFPYIIYTQFRADYSSSAYHASSLLSTTAFAIGATYISRWEQMGEGIQWSNINQAPGYNEEDELSVQWMFIWMLIDSAIYFILGWYIRNVIPGKFGYRLPLYYPFTKSYWGLGGRKAKGSSSKHKKSASAGTKTSSGTSSTLSVRSLNKQTDWLTNGYRPDSRIYQSVPWIAEGDLPVGISISKLRKVYKNGKVAVDNLDLDFYEGHVTAFLGRNGAGKTTTINVLTGMLPPSEGSAEVNGWNVDSGGINQIRQNLGFCPQFDMLFDFMTVKEHLDLFASLKSNEAKHEIEADVEELLTHMGLWHVRNELVGKLSGGMQRRVSVAMAFIGNSKVIILDEPTSSIDPHGRRVIWDVILKYREGRTIILCTHHLDEADTLGDRVAILDKGKLRAEGSPMSLKAQHGSGYQLFLEKMPASENQHFDVDQVTTLIKQNCPGAILMSDIGSSLTYTLPSSQLPQFEQLFTSLSDNLSSLGISGFGVSDSTLYEVFEKITESSNVNHNAPTQTSTNNSRVDFGDSGSSNCCSMLAALFRKRFLHTFKDYKSYIALIVLPVLFVTLALAVTTVVPDRSNQPNLELQPSLYPNTYSFYSVGDGTHRDIDEFTSTLFSHPGIGTVCMDDGLTNDKSTCSNSPELLTSAPATPDDLPECHCPTKKHYSCTGDNPRLDTYQTDTNDKLLHISESYDIQDYLLTTHPYYKTNRYGGWTFEVSKDNETTAKVWFDNRAFHSSTSYLNSLSNMILRAAVSSRDGDAASSEYGITVFNHPLVLSQGQLSIKNALEKTADLGVSLTFLAAFSLIPAGLCIYLVMEHVKGEKHLQYVSGVGPIRYWLITFFWDMMMFLLPILITIPLIYAFDVRALKADGNIGATICLFVTYAWAVLPFMYMTLKAFKNTTTAFFTLLMLNMFLGISMSTVTFLMTFFQFVPNIKEAYFIMQNVFLIFPQYSFTSALMRMSINQVRVDILSQFDEGISAFYHPFNRRNGIYWNVVSMAVQGLVFFIITLLIELKTTNCDDRISKNKRKEDELDDDVVKEKARVLEKAKGKQDSLVVKGLSKQYRLHNFRHILAVKDLTFGVQPGEVFGLCGVNGAGKTSTFKMLTGEILASEGSATLHGRNITSTNSRRKIGYCPQINSLDTLLTARQVLSIYAQLKGISNTDEVICNIVDSFGMQGYINKQVKAMSGGMKRNLCVAIALMGNPDLVFLDEPSAGMDPVTRRVVWNQILAAAARGCAIVLTSHSMTECEALCTRMGIMLNGKLACLGSSQHLKNKFGLGYTLKVKVAGPPPHTNKMIGFVRSTWPQAVVKDQHLSTTEFSIPSAGGQTLASLFSLIEKERHNLYIEEYSVFQTTLDQVFIQFARNQQDQIDDSSSIDDSESTSTPHYNPAFYPHREDVTMISNENEPEKSADGVHLEFNTRL